MCAHHSLFTAPPSSLWIIKDMSNHGGAVDNEGENDRCRGILKYSACPSSYVDFESVIISASLSALCGR